MESSRSEAQESSKLTEEGWLHGKPRSALILLMVIGVVNILDRFLPSILAESIKHDLALSDTALGLITGTGFLLVYAFAGIPIARIADKGRYGVVISGAIGLWSVMTILCGAVQTGLQLGISRLGVALGEAGSTPAAHAYISKNFAPNRRAGAMAILTLSIPLGTLAGFAGGGYLGEMLGWRWTFIAMGAVGLVLAPLALFALGRGSRTLVSAPLPPWDFSLFRKRALVLLLIGSALIAFGGYSITSFGAAFLMRSHGMSVLETGVQFGLSSSLACAAGLLLLGRTADRLSAQDPQWLLRAVAIMIICILPFSVAAFFVQDRLAATILLALSHMTAVAYLAPVVAALHMLVPPRLRARASAVLLLCSALAGGLGPLVVGSVSDALEPSLGDNALQRAMLVIPVSFASAAVAYFAASFRFNDDCVERV